MINKITIKNILAVVAAGSLIAVSCTKNFENINIHPTDLDPDDMSSVEKVGTLLPAMIYLLQPQQENNSQMTDQLVYGQLGGYYSAPNMFNNHGGNGHQVANWNPQETMYRGPYIDFMSPFYSNYFRIVEETGGEGAVYVVSNVLKVAIMHRVADTYGPIPYSKVGSGAFEVEYDALDVLYPKLLEDISSVIASLESYGNTPSPALAEYDIMFKGDFSKWLKYANSLKFRIAMRISSMNEELAKTAMQEAMLSGMLLDNADNPTLPTNDNPVYKAAVSWGDLCINASITTYMNGYNDPRLAKYFTRTTGGVYNGLRIGHMPRQIGGASARYSKPGAVQDTPMPVFYAAESWFLMAEAALKNYITGDAETYYNRAIETSMGQWGVAAGNYMSREGGSFAYTDSYNTSNNYTLTSVPGVAWSSESTQEGHLKQILTQKYIANYPFGLESWSDFRRTGYPELIPTCSLAGAEGVTLERGMRRLKYPDQEYSQNPVNCESAVAKYFGGQDWFSKDLDWAKKN